MKRSLAITVIILVSILLIGCEGKATTTTPNASGSVSTPQHTHAFGEWNTVKESTCTDEGEASRSCECGETETKKLDITDHVYVSTVIEATCTEGGYIENVCACGRSYNSDKTAKTGHAFGEWTLTSPATCQRKGIESSCCGNCGASITRETALAEHSYGDWIVTLAATCTDKGEEKQACVYEGCNEGETREISALGGSHAMNEWVNTVEPTCLEDGIKTRGCKKCSYTETFKSSSFGGHSYGEAVTHVAPTCTKEGESRRYCKNNNCSEYQSEAIPSTHDFTMWSVAAEPSCIANGEAKRDCRICKSTETRVLESKNHSYSAWLSISETEERQTCMLCGISETRTKLTKATTAKAVAAYTLTNDQYDSGSTTKPYRRQGGCFNGVNMYQAHITANEETACVIKINVLTGETVRSINVPMGHANDMTYNSKTNRVYVVSSKTAYMFDADTLEYKGKLSLTRAASAIHYNAHNDTYVGYSSGTISTYNSSGTKLKTYTLDKVGVISQGVCADENYIYMLFCTGLGSSKYSCEVHIYDYTGHCVNVLKVSIPNNYEPENISIVDGTLYIGGCSPAPVFTQYKVVVE